METQSRIALADAAQPPFIGLSDETIVIAWRAARAPSGPRQDYRHREPTLSPLAVATAMPDSRIGADVQRPPHDREVRGEKHRR